MFPSLINKSALNFQCEICQLSKHVRNSYPKQPYKSSKPFMIHNDVWGPSKINNMSGAGWFVTFIDNHTRITWLFLMKEKSEVGKVFQHFNNMIQISG